MVVWWTKEQFRNRQHGKASIVERDRAQFRVGAQGAASEVRKIASLDQRSGASATGQSSRQ